jgi:hypothetical protein
MALVQARRARHADATNTKETAPASYFFLITPTCPLRRGGFQRWILRVERGPRKLVASWRFKACTILLRATPCSAWCGKATEAQHPLGLRVGRVAMEVNSSEAGQ